ncbi:MAG: ERMES complex Ca(2+)-binding regulatory GTPase gem1 [Vezdaea aestivalis]|nr:MAG: ERMES complex Ca(2+)-binding regulatory GTPase gem1 [Vezdaea aestivalis]
MTTVRVLVAGDEATGKSSLITSLVKDTFVTNKIQSVLPTITLPNDIHTPDEVTSTVVVDTSALPQERNTLRKEARKCNVILLVYSDNYSYERVALFWMPYFRSLGVNVPVVLCANKADLAPKTSTAQVVADEMLPVMAEFKEIDSCIRTSAKEHKNIVETLFLCQKAVTHPIAPLFDSKESQLKPAAVAALQRIFYLSDKDQDGFLDDSELMAFQNKCFGKPLVDNDFSSLKDAIRKADASAPSPEGISEKDFLLLNKIYAEKGRHETIWIILRTFHYTDNLSLIPSFVSPPLSIPTNSSAELSPAGYRFFMDLFLRSDKDSDGGLNPAELTSLFAPTPGLPSSWSDAGFPSTTVQNEAGHVTLQGWLAQWSMTTLLTPAVTLSYLAYLGYEDIPKPSTTSTSSTLGPTISKPNTTSALRVTPPRKRHKSRPTERTVLHAYLLGAPLSGKSSLLSAFLSRTPSQTYTPTLHPQQAVNSVELPGGKQVHLILEELGVLTAPAVLENLAKVSASDLVVQVYDSSDPDSFQNILSLQASYPHLKSHPTLYAALKADRDLMTQRTDIQPDALAKAQNLQAPLHVSALWPASVQELCVAIADLALRPGGGVARGDEQVEAERRRQEGQIYWVAAAVGGVATMVGGWMFWRRWSASGGER